MCALTCYPLLSVSLWAHCPEASLLSWLYHRQASFNFIPHCWVTNISGNLKGKNPIPAISQKHLYSPSSSTPPPALCHSRPFLSSELLTTVTVSPPLLRQCSYFEGNWLAPAIWLLCMQSKATSSQTQGKHLEHRLQSTWIWNVYFLAGFYFLPTIKGTLAEVDALITCLISFLKNLVIFKW